MIVNGLVICEEPKLGSAMDQLRMSAGNEPENGFEMPCNDSRGGILTVASCFPCFSMSQGNFPPVKCSAGNLNINAKPRSRSQTTLVYIGCSAKRDLKILARYCPNPQRKRNSCDALL